MIEKILRLTHLRVSDQNHISLMKNHTSIKAKLDTHNIGWLRQLSKKFTVNQPLLFTFIYCNVFCILLYHNSIIYIAA